MKHTGFQSIALLFWIALLGAVFAQVEIQIEGSNGWAANLPTWRVDDSWLNALWGGKTITGYHVWIFSFIALAFHLPLFLSSSWSWRMESRIIGSVMVFWIIEDFLWFVFNPAFGISRFSAISVPWHKHWILGVPVDYILSLIFGFGLIGWSYSKGENK